MAFLIFAGICACLYFLFFLVMMLKVFWHISGKRSEFSRMAVGRRVAYEVLLAITTCHIFIFRTRARRIPRYVPRNYIIIHCSIFSHSHWLRAYDEFFVFCWWREHMTNNYRICYVLTPSEANTRFICHALTPSELFVNVYNEVCGIFVSR